MPLNIILVEDDDGDAKAIRRAFTKAKVANPIIRKRDGLEALAYLRGEEETPPPSSYILLVDLNMPRMGGLELIREIRASPELRSAVIFITTTSNAKQDKRGAYDLNVAGYVLKSNAGADFLELVGALDKYWKVVEMPEMRTARQGVPR